MKFLFFSKSDKSVASSRYRAYYLAEGLNRAGHTAETHSIGTDFKSSNTFLENIRYFFKYLRLIVSRENKNSIIFLQRTIYNKYFLAVVLTERIFFGKKFIFDIDDATFEHSFLKTFLLTKFASVVTCGGRFVLDWSRKHNNNSVYFLNSIPPDIYAPAPDLNTRSGLPTIGWIGDGPAHIENLKLLTPIFKRLLADKIEFKFKLVGALGDKRIYALFGSIPNLNFKIIDTLDWANPVNAAGEIAQFNIGVMPLVENRWNTAKYFKTLEYMACGIPPVAANFGENKYIIEDGKNGFLAGSENEWYEKLKLLVLDRSLRLKMGEEAGRTIRDKFTLEKIVSKLVKIASEFGLT